MTPEVKPFVPADQQTLKGANALFRKITKGGNQYSYEKRPKRFTNTLINPTEGEGYIHITTDSAESNNGIGAWIRIMNPSVAYRAQSIQTEYFLEETPAGRFSLKKAEKIPGSDKKKLRIMGEDEVQALVEKIEKLVEKK